MAVMNRFDKLFANPLPSFHPRDLLIGVAGGIALRLVVYYKAKNAKKFRQGVEYGSARWGNFSELINTIGYEKIEEKFLIESSSEKLTEKIRENIY